MSAPPRDEALRNLELLLEIEHPRLAFLAALDHEKSWDDERKLEALALFHRLGADGQAVTLCHRWKLSKLCRRKDNRLYRELFPDLPPRTDKGEKT